MALGVSKKEFQALQAENAYLRQWLDHAQAIDGVTLSQEIADLRSQQLAAQTALFEVSRELNEARALVLETREMALLQEAGIYEYRHPLEDAVAYQSALKTLKDRTKAAISQGQAESAATNWTVNNSAREGTKMVKDFSKLMLRAYNAEADNAVKTLKPYALDRAKEKLTKVRTTIAKLGQTMSIEITDYFHSLRLYELELTAAYLVKKEEEKERIREERERVREEEKAQREFEAEKRRLEKEKHHYLSAIAALEAKGDSAEAADLYEKLAQIDSAIEGVESREANIRAGYVYVISNVGAFGERMVKIGLTRRLDPMDRVRELGDASVPFKFDVHAVIFSDDAVSLEGALHRTFEDRKVNQVNARKEFFYATPREVRAALAEVGSDVVLEFHETPEALEWRASGGDERALALASVEALHIETETSVGALGMPGLPDQLAEEREDAPPSNQDGAQRLGAAPASPDAIRRPQQEAGWFPDPKHEKRLRYWDGVAWTEHVAD